jgi:small subunit ribosomal protein S2
LSKIDIDLKKLLEAGAHFGHQSSRWHPKMSPYIHSKRDGSHIIDLTKTAEALDKALDFLTEVAAGGKQILLVSTKRQARDKIIEVARALNMPYVNERWLGGLLTNQATIGARIRHLKDLETRMANGELAARYSKLEVQRFQEEIDAMNHLYGGIKEMTVRPGALFVVDILTDEIAVREARKLSIPVVALVDTNADPSSVDYAIPSNDDATKAINLILDYVKQAVEDGQSRAKKAAPADEEETKTETKTTAKTAEKAVEPKTPEQAPVEAGKGIG